jgi:hypothetical protein
MRLATGSAWQPEWIGLGRCSLCSVWHNVASAQDVCDYSWAQMDRRDSDELKSQG